MNQQTYSAGEVILFPGPAKALYRVQQGLVRVHAVDDEGNGLTLRYVKPGGVFGEESLTGLTRRYFAEAVTSCVLEETSYEALEPPERQALAAHLAEALEGLYRSLQRLTSKRLKARIAAELLELRESALASETEDGQALIRITHDDLAAAVGSVRETVTKVIGEFVRDGVLEAGYGKIMLTDLEGLRVAAET